MRLTDFIGMQRDQVEGLIRNASEEERTALLVDLAMRTRQSPGVVLLCPGCDGRHRTHRPKHPDALGRVWHTSCSQQALAGLHPEKQVERSPSELVEVDDA